MPRVGFKPDIADQPRRPLTAGLAQATPRPRAGVFLRIRS